MKVYYDQEVDVLYLGLGNETPDGVVEMSEGVNLDISTRGQLIGIEILHASQKLDIQTILSYSLELSQNNLFQKVA
jgi:uncharacterized protein YuzE